MGFLYINASFSYWIELHQRWAHKKAGGSSKNGRTSQPKFLGVKKFGGKQVQRYRMQMICVTYTSILVF